MCRCSAEQVTRYRSRVSGPLLDRIDIQVEVPRPEFSVFQADQRPGEPSSAVRKRVVAARQSQQTRCGKPNALLEAGEVRRHCVLEAPEQKLLEAAAGHLAFSPRACHRVLKVARTIADLAGEASIGHQALSEAIALRRLSASGSAR